MPISVRWGKWPRHKNKGCLNTHSGPSCRLISAIFMFHIFPSMSLRVLMRYLQKTKRWRVQLWFVGVARRAQTARALPLERPGRLLAYVTPPLVTPLTSPCDLMWQKWHNIQPWNCLGADYNHDQDFVGVGVWPRCQPLKGLIKESIFLSCRYKHGEGGTFAIFWHLPLNLLNGLVPESFKSGSCIQRRKKRVQSFNAPSEQKRMKGWL